jgi:flagellar assembly protein FliH
MNTSSSNAAVFDSAPIDSLLYRDVKSVLSPSEFAGGKTGELSDNGSCDVPAQDIDRLIDSARTEAVKETEQRLYADSKSQFETEMAKVAQAIESFQGEKAEYFSRVESDVVHLSLAIAEKILHRETQVDTMLIAGLVHVAIEKLHNGSKVSVQVSSQNIERWERLLGDHLKSSKVEVIADDNLNAADCVLKTELGSVNFSIESQLKEIENGFFDLLRQRPATR